MKVQIQFGNHGAGIGQRRCLNRTGKRADLVRVGQLDIECAAVHQALFIGFADVQFESVQREYRNRNRGQETEKAEELLHEFVVEKSRVIYEELMTEEDDDEEMEDELEETVGGDPKDDFINEVEVDKDDAVPDLQAELR